MASHNDLGEKGEMIALEFLEGNGYHILEKNYHLGKDEVDIIARKDGILVIVEVKTRSSDYYGDPENFVNRKKQSFMIRAANDYVTKHNREEEVRFDVISILVNQYGNSITHIEDAFYPTL